MTLAVCGATRISQLLGDYEPTEHAYAEATSGNLGLLPLMTELAVEGEGDPFFGNTPAPDHPRAIRPGIVVHKLGHTVELPEAASLALELKSPEILRPAATGEWTICLEYCDNSGVHTLFESSRSAGDLMSLLSPWQGKSSIAVDGSNGRTLVILHGSLTKGAVFDLVRKYDASTCNDARLTVEAAARLTSLIARDLDERYWNAFGEYPDLTTDEGLRRLSTVADLPKEAMMMQVKPYSNHRFPGFQGITHYDIGLALFRRFVARDEAFLKLAAGADSEEVLDVFAGRVFYDAPPREHEFRLEVLRRLQEKYGEALLEKMAARVLELSGNVYETSLAYSKEGLDPRLSDSFNNPARGMCDLFMGRFLRDEPAVNPSALACLVSHLKRPAGRSGQSYFL